MLLRDVGQTPQFGDDLGGLGEGDRGAGAAEGTSGAHGEVPVDDLRHAVHRTTPGQRMPVPPDHRQARITDSGLSGSRTG
jgi:hypothetical protein